MMWLSTARLPTGSSVLCMPMALAREREPAPAARMQTVARAGI